MMLLKESGWEKDGDLLRRTYSSENLFSYNVKAITATPL